MNIIFYFIPIIICDLIIGLTVWLKAKENDGEDFIIWLVCHFAVFLFFSIICLVIGIDKFLN